MKALTIYQPWASLIMIGSKPYEFRKWPAPRWIVGQRIVIHAATRKIVTAEVAELMSRLGKYEVTALGLIPGAAATKPYAAAMDLIEHWWRSHDGLPLSAGLGTATLGEPKRAIDIFSAVMDPDDIDPDMWAWPMLDAQPFERPVPMKGAQGFWNWKEAA